MKTSIRYRRLFFILLTSLSLWNCKRGGEDEAALSEPIHIARFEKDLFSISVYGLSDSIAYLQSRYPDFFPLFTHKIIEIGGPDDPEFASGLIAFTTDFTIYRVSKRIAELFPDLSPYEAQLGKAFSRFEKYFPDRKAPKVVSCISGFNQSVITADGLLAISLDKYLGPDDEFYLLLYPPVPDYMRRVMRPERIVPDALQAWVVTEFLYNREKDNLLSQMIYQGRAMYTLKQLLPEISDTLLWGYTQAQMDFCRTHERRMWEYLVENKKLFITDGFTISQFVNEAPFTKEFSQDSPGRAVIWQGYKIIESYMRHQKEITLSQLMAETDYQKILNLSRYNP